MTKKTKNLIIYIAGGISLLIFTYGLTILRSMNSSNQQISRTAPTVVDH